MKALLAKVREGADMKSRLAGALLLVLLATDAASQTLFQDGFERGQGIGFYVRQNGGYLQQTVPHGQGYAVFVEGFRTTQGIGVWREVGGVETDIEITFDNALNLQNAVPYRVRFRVSQMDAGTTLLQARIWPVGQAEPAAWNVEATDATPVLQNLSGGIALDSWSVLQSPDPITAHTLVDDVEVEGLCIPGAP